MGILFIVLAAIFKAVADTLAHHFGTSVFKYKSPQFWDPNVSWNYVNFIPGTKYRADAWHIANSLMIISFCLGVVLHTPILKWYFEIPIAGILFNAVFNLFYNKILR